MRSKAFGGAQRMLAEVEWPPGHESLSGETATSPHRTRAGCGCRKQVRLTPIPDDALVSRYSPARARI
eukprot:4640755-Prymnesium_polylepis.3